MFCIDIFALDLAKMQGLRLKDELLTRNSELLYHLVKLTVYVPCDAVVTHRVNRLSRQYPCQNATHSNVLAHCLTQHQEGQVDLEPHSPYQYTIFQQFKLYPHSTLLSHLLPR